MKAPWLGILLLAGLPGWAAADSPVPGAFSGSYRNLGFAGDNPAGHFTATDLNRLRLEWTSPQWSGVAGNLGMHLAYDNEVVAGGLINTPAFRVAAVQPAATWADLQTQALRRMVYWRHQLYRGWLNWEGHGLQMKLGRQRIAWGSGRMWNPTDRFNPVDPTALEADQKVGVDSGFGEWRYSATGAVQAVAAPGRGAHAVSRKTALRVRDTFGETDVAALAARIGGENVLGADVSANVFDGGLHAEFMHARPTGLKSYSQLSTGYEYTLLNDSFPAGLYLLGEYFYNGAAGQAIPGAADRLNSTVRHLAGFSAGYDLTPLLRLEATAILDPVKGSSFVAPKLAWSVAQNLELSAFCFVFSGRTGSEFGGRANLYAAQFDAYF